MIETVKAASLTNRHFFFKKILNGTSLFLRSLFWTSDDVCPEIQIQGGSIPGMRMVSPGCDLFFSFISSVTATDLLVVIMATQPFFTTYFIKHQW